jgi:hypothetical protein
MCNFNEAGATDNSNLGIILSGNSDLSALVSNVSGATTITCGPSGANGKRSCSCALQSWTPANITGIGFVCIDPATGCSAGEMDCDGGNALGIDAIDDHQIGACTTHAACSTACNTYCAGIGKVQWRSGCENLCQGGTRDNQACICDAAGGGGCVACGQNGFCVGDPTRACTTSIQCAGIRDCPGGSCVGKNNEADQDCQCQCIDYAVGGAGGAGEFRCNLGADIKVVASTPCTNPALVDLPAICAPLTTQMTTGRTLNSNENVPSAQPLGPHTLTGARETCANFDAGTTTGISLVSNIGFFDSTIGDLRALLTVDCQ